MSAAPARDKKQIVVSPSLGCCCWCLWCMRTTVSLADRRTRRRRPAVSAPVVDAVEQCSAETESTVCLRGMRGRGRAGLRGGGEADGEHVVEPGSDAG
jgi:hypothetical protein